MTSRSRCCCCCCCCSHLRLSFSLTWGNQALLLLKSPETPVSSRSTQMIPKALCVYSLLDSLPHPSSLVLAIPSSLSVLRKDMFAWADFRTEVPMGQMNEGRISSLGSQLERIVFAALVFNGLVPGGSPLNHQHIAKSLRDILPHLVFFYEKSSSWFSILFFTLRRSVVFHLSSLLS